MGNFDIEADLIDSREVIERLAELESAEEVALDDGYDGIHPADADELAALRAFADEASYVSDWEHGETFIRDDFFVDYVRELMDDCGYIPADLPEFISQNIDWEGVADDMKEDYADFELNGVTYWARVL